MITLNMVFNSVGLPADAIGIIMGIARVLEAITNFLTGIAIDRIDSKKGRTKPILYYTTLPLAIMFFLLFLHKIFPLKGKCLVSLCLEVFVLWCYDTAVPNVDPYIN